MAAEGALPEIPPLLGAVHFPALPGAPAVDSHTVAFSFLCMGIIIAGAFIMRLAMEHSPTGMQNLLEWLIETVETQATAILGEEAVLYMPLFATLFIFILVSNLIGLIPGCVSPTASYHTNLAMALVVALVTQYAGIRSIGFKAYLSHFLPPPCPWWLYWSLMWWMWPLIHILEQFIRPISLTMRLYGNLYAKEMLLLMLSVVAVTFFGSPDAFVKVLGIVPFLMRPAIILLGTLVSIVQAAVFTILAMVYVALAQESHDEGHAEAHAH